MTSRPAAVSFGGVAPAGDLSFRIATGTFVLPDLAPSGDGALSVRLALERGLQVLLEVLDPDGRLRLQVIRYKAGVSPAAIVSADAARTSLNARTGPLPPGDWTWRAAVRNVSPLDAGGPRPLRWTGTVAPLGAEASDGPGDPDDACPAAESLERAFSAPAAPLVLRFGGEGWAAGDLHQHTTLSDGVLAPDRLAEANLAAGHSFFAFADHQVLQPPRTLGGAAALGGVELTTPVGHFLRLGPLPADGLIPDAPGAAFADCADLARLRARFRAEGALLVLCHPCFPPWHWRCGALPDDGAPFDALEILCDPTHPGAADAAEAALALWTDALSRGSRTVGVGGSDYHGPAEGKHAADGGARPGDPTTFVRCAALPLSHDDVLSAIRAGRAAVGRGFLPGLAVGPAVPGQHPDRLPGDVLSVPPSAPAALAVRAAALPAPSVPGPLRGELVGAGGIRLRVELPVDGSAAVLSVPLPDRPSGWLRLDVRDREGRLAGFTNPVYWTREENAP